MKKYLSILAYIILTFLLVQDAFCSPTFTYVGGYGKDGVEVFNISSANSCVVSNDLLICGRNRSDDNYITIFDISNRDSDPVFVREWGGGASDTYCDGTDMTQNELQNIWDLRLYGDVIVTSHYSSAVGVANVAYIDISNPNNPCLLGMVDDDIKLNGGTHDTTRVGNYTITGAYIDGGTAGACNVAVIDHSNPMTPIIVECYESEDTTEMSLLHGIHCWLDKNICMLAADSDSHGQVNAAMIDISDLPRVTLLSSFVSDFLATPTLNLAYHVRGNGSPYAYIHVSAGEATVASTNICQISVWDLSDHDITDKDVDIVGCVMGTDNFNGIYYMELIGDYAIFTQDPAEFSGTLTDSFGLVNISDPFNPHLVLTQTLRYATNGAANGLKVDGNYIYISSTGGGDTDNIEIWRMDDILTDTDNDGIADDGDGSGIVGDNTCSGGNVISDACPNHTPARIEGTIPVYYATIWEAYPNADNDTIQCQDIIFVGDFDVNENKTVLFEGGYSCDYASVVGSTIISGDLTISNGEMIIENGILKVQ
jgi:hypothetical protein